jgi:hypothetical protein
MAPEGKRDRRLKLLLFRVVVISTERAADRVRRAATACPARHRARERRFEANLDLYVRISTE